MAAVLAGIQHTFDFEYLHNFTHSPNTPQIYILRPFSDQSVLALSLTGCIAAVGSAFVYYSRQDVYDRVILWRLPLIALWATTTLPALGLSTQIFTLVHLIADPIDTVWSLLYKLDLAKRTTQWAKTNDQTVWSFVFKSESAIVNAELDKDESVRMQSKEVKNAITRTKAVNRALQKKNSALVEYFHDVPALIVTAYDEWGYGEEAMKALNYGFNSKRWNGVQRTKLRKRCAKAAFLIASDRVSRFLPSIASGAVFVFQIFSGFWKSLDTLSDTYDKSNPASVGLNRTPHNIAFGALFFWLPFVVLLTAHVGGSQTSHMIPQVLEDLREDFAEAYCLSDSETREPVSKRESTDFPDLSSEKDRRWCCGGLPVWQTEKFKDFRQISVHGTSHRSFAWRGMLLSFWIVAIPTACAITLSWRTLTEGFGCRAMTQLSFLLMWIVSACADGLLFVCAGSGSRRLKSSTMFWITFAKDFAVAVATITTLTLTALGVFNKCECWCKWPRSSGYISFLQDDFVFQTIRNRLSLEFPVIVGCALLFQIATFVGVWIYFREGHRVLKQRDIDSVLNSEKSLRHRLWRRFSSYFSSEHLPTSFKRGSNETAKADRNVAYHAVEVEFEEVALGKPNC